MKRLSLRRLSLLALGLAVVGVIIALSFRFSTPWLDEPYVLTCEPLEEVSVRTELEQYPPDTQTVHLILHTDVWFDFCGGPQLQMEQDGQWYSLKDNVQPHDSPAVQFGLGPGNVEFDFDTGIYGRRLRPGHYRVLFILDYGPFPGKRWTCAEFDVV